MMPQIPMDPVATAFNDFFSLGPIAFAISLIVGGAAAAFLVRLVISAIWR